MIYTTKRFSFQGGEYVEFVDETGKTIGKNGKPRYLKNAGKKAMEILKKNKGKAIAGTVALGTAAGAGIAYSKKKKKKEFSSTLRQKIFFLGLQGEAITGDQLKQRIAQDKANGTYTKASNSLDNLKLDSGTKIEQNTLQRQTQRAANKANASGVKEAAMKARTQGYNAGVNAGMNAGAKSVGVMGGLKNTWNRSGALGKAGMVGTGLLATGLVAKGLFGGGNKDD